MKQKLNTKEISNIVEPVPTGTKRPLWSVMIPTFNPGKYFVDAINSVISQDPGPELMQIEVVDDCSTKVDIPKIIDENWKGRVGYYRLPKNVGHSFNFTESVRRAKGELIHLLHDDDKVKPGFYTKFETIFKKYEDAGAVFCRQEYIDDDDKFMFYSEPEMEETGILDDALIRLAEKQRIQYCAMVVRRKVYEQLGGYVPKNIGCEDWEMWVRIAAHFQIGYEPEALAQYRIHRTSMTLTDMRTGQDMRFLREAADIFTQYLPEEKRDEVTLFRNKHYAVYSFNNAKRMYQEFNDEEGAASQLSETIILNSELIYSNLDFLSEFNIPIESAGVSVVICTNNNEETIERTLRHLIIQKVPKYIPWEIIIIDNSSSDDTIKIAKETWSKFNGKTSFKIIEFEKSGILETRNNAIRNARYNFVLFCNPGNLLGRNYIRYVSQNMMRDINLGALGAYTELYSKVETPAWFKDWSNYCYQIGEQYEYTSDITWSKGYVWGSGMAIRKEAWEDLLNKNFKSVYGNVNNKAAASGIDSELCYAMRLNGWRIWYSIELKLNRLLTKSELDWKHLRRIWNQYGADSVLLNSYINPDKQKTGELEKIPVKKNKRKLITGTFRKLKDCKGWKLNSYKQTLYDESDILVIEYQFGRLKELLKDIPYNQSIRLFRRIARKKDFRFIKYIITNPYFRFPQYKKQNDRRGVSVILSYNNTSYERLFKSLEKISGQKLSKDFPWEVILICDSLKDESKNNIYRKWESTNCSASLKIIEEPSPNDDSVKKIAIKKSKFDYLIFLNENNFINSDYVRIAYKVIHKYKDTGILGGQTELESDVNPPKWFINYKDYYSVGKQADKTSDLTYAKGYLWNIGVVARKKALKDIYEDNFKFSLDPEDSTGMAGLSNDPELSYKIRLAGWKIKYEPRLILKNFISVRQFSWEYIRNLSNTLGAVSIKEESLSKLINGNADVNEAKKEKSWLQNATKTLVEIKKHPLKKIFSKEYEYKGDSEILEIERLQGRFKEIIRVKGKYSDVLKDVKHNFNGNGFKDLKLSGNGTTKKNEKQKGVSIVICCYNSSSVLPQTLINICTQKVPDHIPWEVIVVDNASTDNTSQDAQKIWNAHNCLASFKIVKEPILGLSVARQKGFDTARYEYIVFCDDDNWLNEDFVKLVYEIMESNKEIGVLGGQSKAEFDVSPANWFKDWENSFAIGRQSDKNGDITGSRGYVWGASMVVRKEAWKKLLSKDFKSILTDRKGNALSAGGDTEICYALRNEGWKIWYDSRLKFKHFLPSERLNWKYLRKLFRGFGEASAGLDNYLENTPKNLLNENQPLIPKSKRTKIHKTLSTLRSIRYKKLLSFEKKREGDTDIPMIEYSLGRLEGLLKTKGTYNRGLKTLKRIVKKRDYPYLASVFRDYNIKFPRYNLISKLNGVSVIVCTYNGADRLKETIRHIAKQKVDPRILWEVILVDNASTDNSKEVTLNEWKKHRNHVGLKIVDQPIPGKQLALEKGYEVAKYEYLVTCDDDNWLDENFIQITYEIMSNNKKIGALGGPNEPVCEVEPPEWFTFFKRDYASGPQLDVHTGKVSEGDITWKRGYVWGAGMVVRKSAWEKLISEGFKTSMSCRKGNELSSGGDSEACYALVLAGWQIWYDSRLKLKHCMPAGRLNWNYLSRLFVGFGAATVGLELYEKAIKLAHADSNISKINNQNWLYEFRRAVSILRKYGIKKILSLRFPQDNNTGILMLEFYISKLKELIRVRKEYDKNFELLKNAEWKKDFSQLKAEHRKYLESENDFRYGWPWSKNTFDNNLTISENKIFPKISVLSPSFNSGGSIEKAILSVLNQGYANFEHIIYDGGSSDGTVGILKKYPHLKWVSEPDKGQSDAMNKAFDMSTGDIIAYLNVDDYFQRGAFHKISKAFQENPSAEMVVGNLFFEFSRHTFTRKAEIDYKKIMLPFKYIFPINPVSYFYKRKVQESIGAFPLDNHYAMDYWFLLRAYQTHKLVKIEDYLGTFCMNGLNKTSNANNRKNVHLEALQHLKTFDRKNLPYYLYNYYKFFYYERKPYNLKTLSAKIRKSFGKVYSILSLKKNKYYSGQMYQKSRANYYSNKRFRSTFNMLLSFLFYPKGLNQRSRQSLFLYSIIGSRKVEQAKIAYFFFTTPPGLPLANKLFYFGNEFKKSNRAVKGNLLLLLTYIISPNFFFKSKQGKKSNLEKSLTSLKVIRPAKGFINFFRYKEYKKISHDNFEEAGKKYFYNKNIQASLLIFKSFLFYPASIKKRSRWNLLIYSAFRHTWSEKIKFVYHIYYDNPEYSFAHKLNYHGHELKKANHSFKGNAVLLLTYLLSPKYISKREKINKSNIIYVSNYIETKKNISLNPLNWGKNFLRYIKKLINGEINVASRFWYFYEMTLYKFKLIFYYYFKYKKYRVQSKKFYQQAQDNYNNNKRFGAIIFLILSFLFNPRSIFSSRNKWSLLVNSILGRPLAEKAKRRTFK
ncbi:MAG: glycosyltransferase [Bacteroidota bacterium]|nr:glycosyltransferase [Bacteroidota bacterium]